MLNEGYALYKSLERCGIRLTNRHPDIKEPGKREGLIVGLNKRGVVARFEYRKAEDVAKLWTRREGMHNSFPVLKLQRPLWKIGKNDSTREMLNDPEKDEPEKRKFLSRQNHALNITESEDNWWERLRKMVRRISPFFETKDRDYTAMHELMERFLLAGTVENFADSLLKELKRYQQEISYSLYETILIGSIWKSKEEEFRAEVPLILDLSDWEKFSVRVASPKMEPFVSECLFRMQGSDLEENDRVNETDPPSALSGRKVQLEIDKFPSPKLPIIGNTYLFAVNDQTPCQSRYGKTSTDIIPIGREEATAIQNSLNWTTEDERQGKTWYPVPGLSEGERDLLIVYLDKKPDLANKAQMLGGMSKDYFSESTYEAVASVTIDALQGEKIVTANDLIRLFALRKADLGRTQVSLQHVYTISELLRADKEWREAADNVPNVSIPFFRKEIERVIVKTKDISAAISQFLTDEESEVIFLSTRCPFPADLVRVTQKQWVRFGQESASVSGVSLGDVYDIFFAQQNNQKLTAENLLSLSLQRTQSLLVGLGDAEHKKQMGGFSADTRFTALTTISAFGIYLHKLDIRKELYMKDTFFYVGRFLSLIDTLHMEYCKHVRGGSIPPQLLGNAHLQIALDNPISALDMLSRRINIYQAWTKKEQGDHMRLAWWAVGQIGEVSNKMAEKLLPNSTTSVERAQILLGYLAKSEETEKIKSN